MSGKGSGQLSANKFVGTDNFGQLTTDNAPDYPPPDISSDIIGTANQIVVTETMPGIVTLSLSSTLVAPGTMTWTTGNVNNGIVTTDASGNLKATAATNGQIPIGSTGAAPVIGTITGTANQVIVTNGAGSITLSLPQSINTTSSPTFAGLTSTGQIVVPTGSSSAVSIAFAGHLTTGFTFDSLTTGVVFVSGTFNAIAFEAAQLRVLSSCTFSWSSSNTDVTVNRDTGIVRLSATNIAVGNGNAGDFSGSIKVTDLFTNNAAALIKTNTTLTDQSGAQAGTLANAPSAGNPSKWIAINDNGTTRKIPTWT